MLLTMWIVPVTITVGFIGLGAVVYLNSLLFGSGEDKRQRLANVNEKAETKARAAHATMVMEDHALKFTELNKSIGTLQQKMSDLNATNQALLAKSAHLQSKVEKLTRGNDDLRKAFTEARIEHVREMAAMQAAHDQSMHELEDWYLYRYRNQESAQIRQLGEVLTPTAGQVRAFGS